MTKILIGILCMCFMLCLWAETGLNPLQPVQNTYTARFAIRSATEKIITCNYDGFFFLFTDQKINWTDDRVTATVTDASLSKGSILSFPYHSKAWPLRIYNPSGTTANVTFKVEKYIP